MRYENRIKALEQAVKYDPDRYKVIYVDSPEEQKRADEAEADGYQVIRVEYV
jgi:hypothetical protein